MGQNGPLVVPTQASLTIGDDGLFHQYDDGQGAQAPLPNDSAVRVMSGVLEGSNVNTAETLVDMIGTARRFEMQMKVIASVDQNSSRPTNFCPLANVRRVNG